MNTYRVTHTAKDGYVSTIDREAASMINVIEQMLDGGFIDANTQSWSITELAKVTA